MTDEIYGSLDELVAEGRFFKILWNNKIWILDTEYKALFSEATFAKAGSAIVRRGERMVDATKAVLSNGKKFPIWFADDFECSAALNCLL